MQSILDASFLLLHFGLGSRTHVDDRHAAGQLRQSFLQLLAVIVRSRFFDLLLELGDTSLDIGGLACAFHDGGVFFVHRDAFGSSQVFQLDVLQLDAEVLGQALAAREDGNVLQHGFAPIPESRGFHGAALECASQLVDDECCKGFTLDVLRDDQQWLPRLGDVLEQGQQVLEVGDLLLVDEDVRVLQHALHCLGIRHEVAREIALVELHAFNHVEGRLDRLGFFDRDRAVLADLVHRIGDDFADLRIAVR